MDKLVEVGRKYDMKINVKKTKTMMTSRRYGSVVNIVIEGKNVEQVKKFRYLGAMIKEDSRCDVDIKMNKNWNGERCVQQEKRAIDAKNEQKIEK